MGDSGADTQECAPAALPLPPPGAVGQRWAGRECDVNASRVTEGVVCVAVAADGSGRYCGWVRCRAGRWRRGDIVVGCATQSDDDSVAALTLGALICAAGILLLLLAMVVVALRRRPYPSGEPAAELLPSPDADGAADALVAVAAVAAVGALSDAGRRMSPARRGPDEALRQALFPAPRLGAAASRAAAAAVGSSAAEGQAAARDTSWADAAARSVGEAPLLPSPPLSVPYSGTAAAAGTPAPPTLPLRRQSTGESASMAPPRRRSVLAPCSVAQLPQPQQRSAARAAVRRALAVCAAAPRSVSGESYDPQAQGHKLPAPLRPPPLPTRPEIWAPSSVSPSGVEGDELTVGVRQSSASSAAASGLYE
eukprot:TRINITY_DN10447_c0_g1_i1.p1 TRINITY_DN10447_c0_g1~~TRINITY_DN10447_c0_g1_i1.p1  ORF type:complete len:389 (+),score=52.22 TRINITY_DN10447_c0_g1_i1:69-1169(+)